MSNRIITISREFDRGARTTGKDVATKLGIPCYRGFIYPCSEVLFML